MDHPSHIKFMQFTGKFDKRNTRIYENDIIRVNGSEYCEVSLSDSCYVALFSKDHYRTVALGDFELRGAEVVGNAFENMDLLTGDTPKEK